MREIPKGIILGLALTSVAIGASGLTSASQAADVTLTVSRWAGPQADAQKALLEEYSKETGVAIKFDAIDYGQLKQKQTLNMSTKTGEYDLIYVPEAWFREYTIAGYLTPLDGYVKDVKLTGEGWDLADFSKAGLDVYTADGSLQAIPYFAQTPLLVFNKEMLAAEGIAPPKTWPELLSAAKKLKQAGTGIALPFRQGSAISNIMAILLAGNDGSFFDGNGKLALNESAVVETVTFMQELSKSSLNGSNGWHWDEVAKALQFGQAPMGITASGLFKALEDENESNTAGKLGYSVIPYGKHPAGLLQTWAWAVPADSKNKEEAFKLAAWLASKRALAEISAADPSFISFRASLSSDPEVVKRAPWLAAAKEALSNGVTLPLQPAAPQLLDALATGLSGVVTNSDDPAAMLKQVQETQASKF